MQVNILQIVSGSFLSSVSSLHLGTLISSPKTWQSATPDRFLNPGDPDFSIMAILCYRESVALYRLSVFLAELTSQLSTSLHTTLQPDWQSQTLSESLNLCRYSSLCMGCYVPLPHPTWLTSLYHSRLRSYVTSPRKSCLMLPPPPPTRLGGLPLVCG